MSKCDICKKELDFFELIFYRGYICEECNKKEDGLKVKGVIENELIRY